MATTSFDDEILKHIEAGQKSPDEMGQEHSRRLHKAAADLFKIRDYAKQERKRVNDAVKQQFAYLEEAATEPREEIGDTAGDEALRKVRRIELCWQDYDEARAEQKDIRGAMRDAIKGAEERIQELIANSDQLPLFEDDDD